MAATSVIIPAYNSENSVSASIDSALSQTVAPLEIIVVDDGSTDGTAEVIKAYGGIVRYLWQENAGQGAARNTGLAEAKGEFIALLDADDYWKPEFIERMEGFLRAHPDLVAASCACLAERQGGDYHTPAHHADLLSQHPQGLVLDDFFEFWAKHDHVRTGSVLIRHDAVKAVGLQNPALRISQDLEYWALLATQGPWGLLPEVLWVGTSDKVARQTGWRKKYAGRRKKTPTVEAWEARVLPRMSADQVEGFKRVRGRVAAGFAVNHVLGGSPKTGRDIIRQYGEDMPHGTTIKILKKADRMGSLAWWAAGKVLRYRDARK